MEDKRFVMRQKIDATESLEAPLACRLDVFTSAQRQRYTDLRQQLAASHDAVAEVANGYGWRFPTDSILMLAEFVTLERLCCPFLTFTIELAGDDGPLWLRLTGRAGVKELLQSAFAQV